MWTDLSWAINPLFASTPFLPAGRGALILTLGGLAMLALTAVLSRIMAGPPPKPVPDRTLRGRAVRRETGHARAPPSSARRRDAEDPPKPAPRRTGATGALQRKPAPPLAPFWSAQQREEDPSRDLVPESALRRPTARRKATQGKAPRK